MNKYDFLSIAALVINMIVFFNFSRTECKWFCFVCRYGDNCNCWYFRCPSLKIRCIVYYFKCDVIDNFTNSYICLTRKLWQSYVLTLQLKQSFMGSRILLTFKGY